jgi:hypothetical protein
MYVGNVLNDIVEVNGYVATTRLGKVLNEITEDLIGMLCVCVRESVCL